MVSQEVFFLRNLRNEIWKSLYYRHHYTMQHRMDILSVCGYFWMEELMWKPKMWDEREMKNREKRGRDCETDRGVCIRRGMDDWYLYFFWDVKSLNISIYLQTGRGMCRHCLSSILDGFAIYLSFLDYLLVNECGSKWVNVSVFEFVCVWAGRCVSKYVWESRCVWTGVSGCVYKWAGG